MGTYFQPFLHKGIISRIIYNATEQTLVGAVLLFARHLDNMLVIATNSDT